MMDRWLSGAYLDYRLAAMLSVLCISLFTTQVTVSSIMCQVRAQLKLCVGALDGDIVLMAFFRQVNN